MALRLNQDIDDTVKQYFKLLKKYKPLSKVDEQRLLYNYKYKQDLSARDTLIVSNLKYTCSLANKYRGNGVSFADLISEANSGLITAIEKYDFKRDVKLITYARFWVQQKIQIAVNKHKQMPTDELNEAIGQTDINVDYETVDDVYTPSNLTSDEESFLNEEDNRTTLLHLIECIGKKDRIILTHYFGLNGAKEMTMEEIGAKLHITRERVRQRIERALTNMRIQAVTQGIEWNNQKIAEN